MSLSRAKQGKWIQPALTTYAPAVVVSVIIQTEEQPVDSTLGFTPQSMRRIHVAESHRRREKWSDPRYLSFFHADDFFEWLETKTSAHRRVHVFTTGVKSALTLCSFWPRIERMGCHLEGKELSRFQAATVGSENLTSNDAAGSDLSLPDPVSIGPYEFSALFFSPTTEIVRYRVNGRGFLWTSFAQYVDPDEERIAAACHYAWTQTPALDGSLPNQGRGHQERAFLWCRFFAKLATWWVKQDGGPWGPSVASCAYSYLRRRLTPKTILKHDNPAAGHLEEQAIFGGRRSIWFVGNVGSLYDWHEYRFCAPTRSPHGDLPAGMHHHDIRSMYPFLLSRLPYPVRFVAMNRAPSPAAVLDAIQTFGVIASVVMKTDHAEYPVRTAAGVRYPTGRFATTLCGPELASALSAGLVEKVHHAALYAMGRPFTETSGEMLALREKYRYQEEPTWEMFSKALANSMSGRLALKQHDWTPRPNVAAKEPWGSWIRSKVVRDQDGKVTSEEHWRFQAYAGMVWERTVSKVRCRPMGAAYAYLTAYGRWMMAYVRSCCPARSVLAQDTDGIWTTPAASEVLYAHSDPDSRESGTLHRDHVTPVGRFFGPQHYWWGEQWVLSGHAIPQIRPGTTIVDIRESSVPFESARAAPEPLVFERRAVREIGRIQTDQEVDSAGWLLPPKEWVMPD